MAAKKKEEAKDIEVQLNLKTVRIPIEGISPLIVYRFDEKTKNQMKENGKADTGLKQGGKRKAIADPEQEYENSIYYFADGKTYGFPATGFKSAMVRAAQVVYGRVMTTTKMMFRVMADDPKTGLVKIDGTPRMREDMVRVGTINKVASPRYRAEFPSWGAVITIQFLADVITEKEVIGILNAAGFACGVGEWRPEKAASGSFGMFQVVSTK